MNEAIRISDVGFGIAEGHRSLEKQLQYYNEGKSKLDGINKKASIIIRLLWQLIFMPILITKHLG